MPITSYAQNFEDVILFRALSDVAAGFYIDVGAQDPVIDSVSRGFYELGWRGVHVEPNNDYAQKLITDRPDEIVIQAALSHASGVARFFAIADTGMSTLVEEVAANAQAAGWPALEGFVPTLTLDQLFEQLGERDVHWLKIDVEGHEKSVLQGWATSPALPWIVVVEAIKPMTRTPCHKEWQDLLIKKGYAYAWFDGVNRYYLAPGQQHRLKLLEHPISLWDEFQIPPGHRTAQQLALRHEAELGQLRASVNGQQAHVLELEQSAFAMQAEADRLRREQSNAAVSAAHNEAARLETERALVAARVELETTVEHFGAALRTSSTCITELTAGLEAVQKKLSDAESQKIQISAALAQADAANISLSKQVVEASDARDAAVLALQEVRSLLSAAATQQELTQAQGKQHSEELVSLLDSLRSAAADNLAALDASEKRTQDLNAQLAAATASMLEERAARGQAEAACDTLKATLADRQGALEEAQLAIADLEALRHSEAATRSALLETRAALEELRAAHLQALLERDALHRQRHHAEANVERATTTIETLRRILSQEERAKLAHAADSARLQDALQAMRANAETSATALDAAHRQIAALDEVKLAEAAARGALQETRLALEGLRAAHISALVERNTALHELQRAETIAERSNATVEGLRQALAQEEQVNRANAAELATLRQTVGDLQSSQSAVRSHAEGLAAQVDALSETLRQTQVRAAQDAQLYANNVDTLEQEAERQSTALDGLRASIGQWAVRLETAAGGIGWRIAGWLDRRSRDIGDVLAEAQALVTVPRMLADADGGFATVKDLIGLHDKQFVEAAYRTILLRDPDEEGARTWLMALRNGATRFNVASCLYASPERAALKLSDDTLHRTRRYFSYEYSSFWGPVRRLARRALGRRDNREMPPPFLDLITHCDDQFVDAAYRSILGRPPDGPGLGAEISALRRGVSRWAVVRSLRRSDEGRAFAARIPDLDQGIAAWRRRQWPLMGGALRKLDAGPARRPPPLAYFDSVPAATAAASRPARTPRLAAPSPAPVPPQHDAVLYRAPLAVVMHGEPLDQPDVHVQRARHLKEALAAAGPATAQSVASVNAAPPAHNGAIPMLLACADGTASTVSDATAEQVHVLYDGVGAVSTSAMKALQDRGVGVPVQVVGLGIDDWDRLDPSSAKQCAARQFRFLHVSACDAASGVDGLIQAFAQVFDRSDEVSLVIYPTANVEAVRAMIDAARANRFDCPDLVLLDRPLDDRALKALYQQCQVFAAAHRECDFGEPLARALLCCTPVIATAYGGPADYVDAGAGWPVDFQYGYAKGEGSLVGSVWAEPDKGALESALWQAFRSSPEERRAKGELGRDRVRQRYSWASVAQNVNAFATDLRRQPSGAKPLHLGWVTTWSVKCGIATYSSHLIDFLPSDLLTIYAGLQGGQLGADEPHVQRIWTPSKDAGVNHLGAVLASVDRNGVDAVMIQFNYGFYNHAELAGFINALVERGKIVMVDLHSTIDPADGAPNFNLAELAPSLKQCTRVLAHAPGDLNRLKALGLTDNVLLFPHGVLTPQIDPVTRNKGAAPLLASFGFAFPNKGLRELIHAVRILKDQGRPVRLRMVNSEFPAPISADYVAQMRRDIADMGLGADIELYTDFLDDERCFELLQDADLMVNPYQDTGESASGSVRYGLAIARPVAVTPLPIFDDLGGAVFRLPGVNPRDLATGIATALDLLAADAPLARSVASHAMIWREEHAFSRQAARLVRVAQSMRRA